MTADPELDPEALLLLARAGNAAALGELLRRYDNYLTLLARLQIGRRLQRKLDPDDLVQETYLAAHRGFLRFRGASEAEFLNWLRQLLAWCLAKSIRHYCGTQRRDIRLEDELALELGHSSQALDGGLLAPGSSPSRQASRREQAVLLADALAQLPEAYREVLILHYLEGLRFREVAERLGRTLDSVKNVWVRALARLRRIIGDAP
jgi:RNA polymerase sigma-70 factor (ECF subfamily)